MAEVAQKVKNALDEARLLILVVQVFIGFQMRAPFEPAFANLSDVSRGLEVTSLTLFLAAFVCLLAPAPFIELALAGQTSTEIQVFTSAMVTVGLLPFVAALWWWYGMGLKDRRAGPPKRDVTLETPLSDRIEHVMTEARMIVPGAQALLGFQFATFFMTGFERLPLALKQLHVASLSLVGLATVFLIAPAAYHRIAEYGEDSERVAEVGSRMVLVSLVPLAIGIASDVVVVLERAELPRSVALLIAGTLLVCAAALWLVYPLWRRRHRHD
jgi:hypothetical protein